MSTPEQSNKERAIELRTAGVPIAEIARELGLSRVTIYKYFEGTKPHGASTKSELASIGVGGELEMQLLRIENQALKAQLDVYKAECLRLRALLEE